VAYSNRKYVIFRASLTGLSVVLRNAIVIIYSRGVLQLLLELELELIQTQMAQKPMLRAEVGMRVRCANKASAE